MCEPSKLTGVSNFLTGLQQTTHKRTVQSRETKYSRCVGVAKKRCLGYLYNFYFSQAAHAGSPCASAGGCTHIQPPLGVASLSAPCSR